MDKHNTDGVKLYSGGKEVSKEMVEQAIADYEQKIKSPENRKRLQEFGDFLYGKAEKSSAGSMPQADSQTQLINRTGREISFDWRQVFKASGVFEQSDDPYIWILDGASSVCVRQDSITIHPGNEWSVRRTLDVLAVEVGRFYNCDAELNAEGWPGKLEVILTLRKVTGFETVCFGKYPQYSDNPAQKEPIEWIVLDRTKDTLTLLSKYALHRRGYCDPKAVQAGNREALIWEHSDIRKWMNGAFAAEAFSREEYGAILHTSVITQPDMDASEQLDKLFLLSGEQLERWIPDEKNRCVQATPYAVRAGATIDSGNCNCAWWVLPFHDSPQAVAHDGKIWYHGRNIYHNDFCVRPAIRVKAQHVQPVEVQSGRGARKTTRISCAWEPVIAERFDWKEVCTASGIWKESGKMLYIPGQDAVICVWEKEIYLLGDRERIYQALRKSVEKRYYASASITENGDELLVELLKIERSRLPLNEQKAYFLTQFRAGGKLLRISVDVETASDSHYVLHADVVNTLILCLWKMDRPYMDLQQTLEAYFRKHSHYDFARLLKEQQIPFKEYHYD